MKDRPKPVLLSFLLALSATTSVLACFPGDRHYTPEELRYFKQRQIELNKSRDFVNTRGDIDIQFLAQNADLLDARFHEGLLRVRNIEGEYNPSKERGRPACFD